MLATMWVVYSILLANAAVLQGSPISCSTDDARAQLSKWESAFRGNGSWSACGAKEWLVRYYETSTSDVEIIFDIGCNKGYESGLMMSLFKPDARVSPNSLYKVHQQKGRGLEGHLCGACKNCEEVLSGNRQEFVDQEVHLYCFEPSLTNFGNLLNARNEYEDQLSAAGLHWHLINSAVGSQVSLVKFPRSCGSTLCQIGEAGSKAGPSYEATFMTSVDAFLEAEGLQHIGVLKIDTEGHDPAVIFGSKGLLQAKKVTLLYFEYNGVGLWKTVQLADIVVSLDALGYDCYFEGWPILTRLTGCWMSEYEHKVWSNVVCANRANHMAQELEKLTWQSQGMLN